MRLQESVTFNLTMLASAGLDASFAHCIVLYLQQRENIKIYAGMKKFSYASKENRMCIFCRMCISRILFEITNRYELIFIAKEYSRILREICEIMKKQQDENRERVQYCMRNFFTGLAN